MSEQLYWVKYGLPGDAPGYDSDGGRRLRYARRAALSTAATYLSEANARLVRIIPKAKPERRVFEGVPRWDSAMGAFYLGEKSAESIVSDHEGKRVRVTVEVLPDAKVKQ